MAWPLILPYLIGAAVGVGTQALQGNTGWKSLVGGGIMGALSGGVGGGMFGGGSGASGVGASTGGAAGGGWWNSMFGSILGGQSFGQVAGSTGGSAGGGAGGALPSFASSFPQSISYANSDPSFFKAAFPGGVAKGSGQGIGQVGSWGGSTPDLSQDFSFLSKIGANEGKDKSRGGKEKAKISAIEVPAGTSASGQGVSSSIGAPNPERVDFSRMPGISTIPLPRKGKDFGSGSFEMSLGKLASASSPGGLSHGVSRSAAKRQGSRVLDEILKRYRS